MCQTNKLAGIRNSTLTLSTNDLAQMKTRNDRSTTEETEIEKTNDNAWTKTYAILTNKQTYVPTARR